MALRSQPELVRTVDIVFSCAVCQRTLADAFPESSSRPSAPPGGLWMADCRHGHVFCGSHLLRPLDTLSLGEPLPDEKAWPKAICPVCRDEANDSTEKTLVEITGPDPTTNPQLPMEYFQTPPSYPSHSMSTMMVRVPHSNQSCAKLSSSNIEHWRGTGFEFKGGTLFSRPAWTSRNPKKQTLRICLRRWSFRIWRSGIEFKNCRLLNRQWKNGRRRGVGK